MSVVNIHVIQDQQILMFYTTIVHITNVAGTIFFCVLGPTLVPAKIVTLRLMEGIIYIRCNSVVLCCV